MHDDEMTTSLQTPYYWPSQNHVPDSTDYAIYIHKKIVKTKQKHVLEEYELVSTSAAQPRVKRIILFDSLYVLTSS